MYNAWIDPLGFNGAFGAYGYGSWSDFLTGVTQGTTGQPATATGAAGAAGGAIGGLVGTVLGTNRPATPQPVTSPTGQVAVNYTPAAPSAAIGIPALILGGVALWFLMKKK
jgi:hypothetical protein